jgi:hypothetical protein
MSEDGLGEYDRTYQDTVDHQARHWAGYNQNQQIITRFVAQLECRLDGEWKPTVRFDRDP